MDQEAGTDQPDASEKGVRFVQKGLAKIRAHDTKRIKQIHLRLH